jgi:putative peptidoglycan lipid II flippase
VTGGSDVVGRHGRLVSRTALVSGLTLLSRVLGYARESVMAGLFGHQSAVYDAFITAWKVPNLFRRLLGEGALSTSLQTTLTEVDADHGDAAGRAVFVRTLFLTSWILAAVCTVAVAAVNLLPASAGAVDLLGSDPAAVRELTTRLLPFVVFVCLSALASGALQVRGEFVVSSLAPAVLNLFWIALLGVVVWRQGWPGIAEHAQRERELALARALSWMVLAAGAAMLLVQVPSLRRNGLLGPAGPVRGFDAPVRARQVLKSSLPLAIGAAVYQVNVMVDGWMAQGMLTTGGPTAYHFATRVQHFPVALVALAATSAVFPSLKALGHLGRREELRALHDRAQLGVFFLALPACVGLIALATPICALLFQHGRYGAEGVERIAATLTTLSLAVLPAGALALLSRAYYALGDFVTPVRVSIAMLALNVLLNMLFVGWLRLDAPGFGLSTALVAWLNLGLLWPGLHKRLGLPRTGAGTVSRVLRMLACALASGLAARALYSAVLGTAEPNGAHAALAMALAILAALALYALGSRALGLEEGRALLRRLGWLSRG